MKLKHTPGPWRAKRFSVIKSNGYKITQNRPAGAAPEAWEEIDKTYEANARLIAAAPEMLEALIEAYIHNNHWGSANYHRFSEDLEFKMKNIIEKATGMSIEEVLNGNNNNN